MQRPFFILIFLAILVTAEAQTSVPVFGNPDDSTSYAKTDELLLRAMQNPRYFARIDSLIRARAILSKKAIRYRTSYTLPRGFTRYTQLPAPFPR